MTVDENLSGGSFAAMEPLYERLFQQKFISDKEAIDYCRKACLEYGFNIKHETGTNRSIYIYCSREKTTRKRPSSNSKECQWRIVLSQDEAGNGGEWRFRKSSSSAEHNHELLLNDEWPQEVLNKISQLSRQNQKDEEIGNVIKLEFPNIIWNENKFLNYLLQERKRQKQKDVQDRVQKLIMASTKLCSVVAANEDWTSCVENDLSKMLENYRQRTRVSNQSLDSMVDLQLDMIHSEIDKVRKSTPTSGYSGIKKRRSNNDMLDSVQIMSIPSCTLYIRSQPLRSLSEPSNTNTNSRRAFNDLISSSSSSSTHQQLNNTFNVNNNVFTLTSPISSPSSTSSIQQRMDFNRNNEMLQSPPIPDSNMIISPNSYQGNNTAATNSNYNVYPFSSYQQSNYSSNSSGGGTQNATDVNFSFEPTTTYGQLTTTPSSAPILIHRNDSRLTYGNNSMYYTSNGRESSPTGIQQRMMMQQEYEQRHLVDNSNVHLPTIRSTGNHHHHLMNTMVQQQQQQQQQHHHHHHHMNPPQQQQNWS